MKLIFLKAALTAVACLVVGAALRAQPTNVNSAQQGASTSSASTSDVDRLQWLEKNGEVPEGTGFQTREAMHEWQLAQKTTWWGKRLEPREFWKNRVVWLDETAEDAAHRHGRGYPPMPFEDKSLPRFADDDGFPKDNYGTDGRDVPLATSSLERVFWDKFEKTMPQPPEHIERAQSTIAEFVFSSRYLLERAGNPTRTTSQRLEQLKASDISRAKQLGCPAEALTDNALYWAYVQNKRQDYQNQLNKGMSPDNPFVKRIVEETVVDPHLITEPLSDSQIQQANAWKISYLKRLQNQKVDRSYINAYLKAWNLSPDLLNSTSTGK